MDFTYTEEQKMMQEAARGFLEAACPNVEWHLKMDSDEKGYTDELWKGMAELGWMGILFPEEYGGVNWNILDLVVLMEEMGRAALPGPYFSTVVLGGLTILDSGSDAQKKQYLPKIAEGKLKMTLALTEPATTRYDPCLISVQAKKKASDYLINGTKLFVPDVGSSDYVIVAARTKGEINSREGITLFLMEANTPGMECTRLKTLAGDKQYEIVFRDAPVSGKNIIGTLNQGWAGIERVLQKAAVAKCAEMLGGSQKIMELAVDYAKIRVQFGKAIGTYQAIQHHCANMKMAIEPSIFITYKAAWMIANQIPEAGKFASLAKSWVSEAAKKVAILGHQIFGGTGYIVEHPLPIYSRRAKAAEYALGNANYHREIVARELGL